MNEISQMTQVMALNKAQRIKLDELQQRLAKWEIEVDVSVLDDLQLEVTVSREFAKKVHTITVSNETLTHFAGDIETLVTNISERIMEIMFKDEIGKMIGPAVEMALNNARISKDNL